jgi:hypothetical protein
MKRLIIIAACAIGAVFLLLVVGDISTRAYLRTRATAVPGVPLKSPDGKFQIVMYRNPRLYDVPESLGFGQGFVRLREVASGKVLAQKHAEELSPLREFKWSATNIIIYHLPGTNDVFADWDLPK